MINSKELQKGNYLMDSVSGEWMEVDEIGVNVGASLLNREKYPLPKGWSMAPIALTEDIMFRLGFQVFPWGYVKLSNKEVGVRINLRSFRYDVSGQNSIEIKYVHKLQNLYYILTGEELTIKK